MGTANLPTDIALLTCIISNTSHSTVLEYVVIRLGDRG